MSKLLAIKEQELNFSSVLEWSRALREQIEWREVRERTQESPFAKAFFVLIEELGIVSLEEELAPVGPPVVGA